MAERVQATRLAAIGTDTVPGWYVISLEEVTGLQSREPNLQLMIPSGVALAIAHHIQEHRRDQTPTT
jgi:hypothetical protein